MLSFIPGFPDPGLATKPVERHKLTRRRKLVYYILAGILGVVLLGFYGDIRIFRALGFGQTNETLDSLMTGLILVAGADRIPAWLKLTAEGGASGGGGAEAVPIEITGRIVLESPEKS